MSGNYISKTPLPAVLLRFLIGTHINQEAEEEKELLLCPTAATDKQAHGCQQMADNMDAQTSSRLFPKNGSYCCYKLLRSSVANLLKLLQSSDIQSIAALQ